MTRQRHILHELICECTLLKGMINNLDFRMILEDEFTAGIIEMLATRRIPIWLVFACQIQCDVRCILEERVVQCHEELQEMGQRVTTILTSYLNFEKDFQASPLGRTIKTTIGEVECWITEDFPAYQRTRLHTAHGILEEDMESYYYLRRHPFLCGLLIFRFSLTMNELGLQNSNFWGSTIAAVHLYNAVRHEIPGFPEWLDMGALILIHSVERIFWRKELPTDCAQYTKSYERATGVSEMIFQRKVNTSNDSSGPHPPEEVGTERHCTCFRSLRGILEALLFRTR